MDIEIARSVKLRNISEVASDLGLSSDDIELYGKYKCKIDNKIMDRYNDKKDGKLILVTAISPTPLGEGKTTISIALADGLRRVGEKSILALREPSMGPVFGIKGGATGGGYVQIAPMEDINLHFTGDIHAISSANNLLSAAIDNHIYFGNELGIKRVVWKRCVDLNDRQLRVINTGLSGEEKIVSRMDGFDISVASEIMSILCLSKDIFDLKRKLGNIIIGYGDKDKIIYARDLNIHGSMAVILKDAIKPNLVQSLEGTPALVHGGPFANISLGCNSIIATNMALKLGNYVVTEAGFGADLGCEKFLDIKTRELGKTPFAIVLVATLKALKYHGGVSKEDVYLENLSALDKGLSNLYRHVDNIRNKFGINVIVAINRYNQDTDREIEYLGRKLEDKNILYSIVTGYKDGGVGAIDLANKVISLNTDNNFKYIYDTNESIQDKILKVSREIYGARNVIYSDKAIDEIKLIERNGLDKYPICIAKTQYSFSDDAKLLDTSVDFDIHVTDVSLKNGAGFIVVLCGNIMTMPGLSRVPSYEKIDINDKGEIEGIF